MAKRQFKPRERSSGFRDARLIVIATEGTETEKQYFKALADQYRNPKVHVEVLERVSTASSPDHVIGELDKFRHTFSLDKYDELWLVIVGRTGGGIVNLVIQHPNVFKKRICLLSAILVLKFGSFYTINR